MRILMLMRGIPACGKSTWIESNNLSPYTLCPDILRLMVQSPILSPSYTNKEAKDSLYAISQSNDSYVWKLLFEILEMRFKRGEFSIIDATHISNNAVRRYQSLCEKYRYRIVVVDFSDVSLEEAKRRNASRGSYKVVPNEVIERMHSSLEEALKTPLPKRYSVIKPDMLDSILYKSIDLSKYKRIHHIGDIHGCFSALQTYLKATSHAKDAESIKELINDDEYYIFLGDYIDRGVENGKVAKAMLEIMELPNVCLLEGNHERWLWKWGNDESISSGEFRSFTSRDLENEGFSKQDARALYRKLRQCILYHYNSKSVLATHGGLSSMPSNLAFISLRGLIYGSGDYLDMRECARVWEESTQKSCYQVFGHRNREKLPIRVHERSFALEGGVEFGGELRILLLDSSNMGVESSTLRVINARDDNFFEIYVKNDIFRDEVEYRASTALFKLLGEFEENPMIKRRDFGDISSFNFTKEAFYKKAWSDITCKARGLYIDMKNIKIIARSYNKFFNLNEREETKLANLSKLSYPLSVYIKENGFLGILSVYNNELFAAPKSDITTHYAEMFKNAIEQHFTNDTTLKNHLIEFLKSKNLSLVFEVIEPKLDPHIIKYDEPHLVLLDAIYNNVEYQKLSFNELEGIAREFRFHLKERVCEIADFNKLKEFIKRVEVEGYKCEFSGRHYQRHIEGFVIEDRDDFAFKLKLAFYNTWKVLNGVLEQSIKLGEYRKSGFDTSEPTRRAFCNFLREKIAQDGIESIANKSIIELRDWFDKVN